MFLVSSLADICIEYIGCITNRRLAFFSVLAFPPVQMVPKVFCGLAALAGKDGIGSGSGSGIGGETEWVEGYLLLGWAGLSGHLSLLQCVSRHLWQRNARHSVC